MSRWPVRQSTAATATGDGEQASGVGGAARQRRAAAGGEVDPPEGPHILNVKVRAEEPNAVLHAVAG